MSSKIIRLLHLLTPPIFKKIAKFFLKKDPDRFGDGGRKLHSFKNPITELKWTTGYPVFEIEMGKVRYTGGIPYSYPEHQFLRYYIDGKESLREHYNRHQPKNIFELHYLETPSIYSTSKISISQVMKNYYFVPWLKNVDPIPDFGEHGLDEGHGNQVFGPVSDEKIRLECDRLDHVLTSIRKHGFDPEQFDGYPKGYFLVDNKDNWVFILQSGFHRVASLAFENHNTLPVQFSYGRPRIVKKRDSKSWPMVKDGIIREEDAIRIFDCYFDTEWREINIPVNGTEYSKASY